MNFESFKHYEIWRRDRDRDREREREKETEFAELMDIEDSISIEN